VCHRETEVPSSTETCTCLRWCTIRCLAYGLHYRSGTDQNLPDYGVSFAVKMKREGEEKDMILLADDVSSNDETRWRSKKIQLYEYAYDTVRLCVKAELVGDLGEKDARRLVLWENPAIVSERQPLIEREGTSRTVTPSEQGRTKQRLQALGYAD
jgi:hypothetical protein